MGHEEMVWFVVLKFGIIRGSVIAYNIGDGIATLSNTIARYGVPFVYHIIGTLQDSNVADF